MREKLKMKKYSVDNVIRMFLALNTIKWDSPTISAELESYFGSPETIDEFAKHGLRFTDGRDLRNFLKKGRLTPISEDTLKEVKNFAFSTKDIDDKLSDQTYSQSYKELEHKLERGDINLQAPIIVEFNDGSFWGFSGRKRAYVARKNGVEVLYFLVKQPQDEEGDKREDGDQEDIQKDKME